MAVDSVSANDGSESADKWAEASLDLVMELEKPEEEKEPVIVPPEPEAEVPEETLTADIAEEAVVKDVEATVNVTGPDGEVFDLEVPADTENGPEWEATHALMGHAFEGFDAAGMVAPGGMVQFDSLTVDDAGTYELTVGLSNDNSGVFAATSTYKFTVADEVPQFEASVTDREGGSTTLLVSGETTDAAATTAVETLAGNLEEALLAANPDAERIDILPGQLFQDADTGEYAVSLYYTVYPTVGETVTGSRTYDFTLNPPEDKVILSGDGVATGGVGDDTFYFFKSDLVREGPGFDDPAVEAFTGGSGFDTAVLEGFAEEYQFLGRDLADSSIWQHIESGGMIILDQGVEEVYFSGTYDEQSIRRSLSALDSGDDTFQVQLGQARSHSFRDNSLAYVTSDGVADPDTIDDSTPTGLWQKFHGTVSDAFESLHSGAHALYQDLAQVGSDVEHVFLDGSSLIIDAVIDPNNLPADWQHLVQDTESLAVAGWDAIKDVVDLDGHIFDWVLENEIEPAFGWLNDTLVQPAIEGFTEFLQVENELTAQLLALIPGVDADNVVAFLEEAQGFAGEFLEGIATEGLTIGKGLVDMALKPGETAENFVKLGYAIYSDPGGTWHSMVDQREGETDAEYAGRLSADVLSFFIPEGELAEMSEAAKAAQGAELTANLSGHIVESMEAHEEALVTELAEAKTELNSADPETAFAAQQRVVELNDELALHRNDQLTTYNEMHDTLGTQLDEVNQHLETAVVGSDEHTALLQSKGNLETAQTNLQKGQFETLQDHAATLDESLKEPPISNEAAGMPAGANLGVESRHELLKVATRHNVTLVPHAVGDEIRIMVQGFQPGAKAEILNDLATLFPDMDLTEAVTFDGELTAEQTEFFANATAQPHVEPLPSGILGGGACFSAPKPPKVFTPDTLGQSGIYVKPLRTNPPSTVGRAVMDYQLHTYDAINRYLRGEPNYQNLPPHLHEQIGYLDQALEGVFVKNPLVAYKGLNAERVARIFGIDDIANFDFETLIGGFGQDNGFMSTTALESVARGFNVENLNDFVLEITAPEGVNAGSYGTLAPGSEAEILFNRGTVLRLTGVREVDGITYLQVEAQVSRVLPNNVNVF